MHNQDDVASRLARTDIYTMHEMLTGSIPYRKYVALLKANGWTLEIYQNNCWSHGLQFNVWEP